MLSVISVVLIISMSILITRVATITLMHTGLSKQASRFQARSAFTGVGFTTGEAENIVNHPVRRRIVMTLMLVGNAGIVSVMASLLLTFLGTGEDDMSVGLKLLILFGGIGILWVLSSSNMIDRWLYRLVSRLLKRYTKLNVRDYAGLLHLSSDYAISELMVEKDDWIAGKNLKQASLRDEGINVLGVKRKDGCYIGIPTGETIIEPGDVLILYGRNKAVEDIDNRKEGVHGTIRHKEAVTEQMEVEKKQMEVDTSRQKKESSAPES
ncbi:MAG: TrkA C-terminal domain-containing protein [Candidatus Cyclobacteriaceae bacterium M3_2C_046]